MLWVDGESALDIFQVLVCMLKQKCFERFGDKLILSHSSEFQRDIKVLQDIFRQFSIKLQWRIVNEKTPRLLGSKPFVLKDYILWVPMPNETLLSINFDYDFVHSVPSSLD